MPEPHFERGKTVTTPTPIFDRPIDHPSAWTNAGIGGKAGLLIHFEDAHLRAIDELAGQCQEMETTNIRRRDFSHPLLNDFMREVRGTLMEGRGALVLTGLDAGAYTLAQIERIYWGLGTHLGSGCVQSPAGDRIGYVRDTYSPTPRGYLSSIELRPHTDAHEAMSLMCVHRAESGGLSGLVSAIAIHNEIQATRPELLAPLYRGYYYALHETRPDEQLQMSETMIPVFCNVDGKVSCLVNPFFMKIAARRLGTELPADLVEALAYFYELAERPDLQARFMLEPGEMMVWHNYMNLHSRTEFKDSPEHTRLLLRLWLNMPRPRPVVPEFRTPIYNRFDEFDVAIEPELLEE